MIVPQTAGLELSVTAGHILVVAPNPDFRRSLTFALESEGYAVTEQGGLDPLGGPGGFDAVVLDHKAIEGPREGILSFCRTASPVVLLAGQTQPWLVDSVFRSIPTPLMGTSLVQAVAAAVTAGRRSATK